MRVGKIDVVEALLPKVDALLIGGAKACTFYRAMGYETGTSLVEPDREDMAKELIARAGTTLIPWDVAAPMRCARPGRRRPTTEHLPGRSAAGRA